MGTRGGKPEGGAEKERWDRAMASQRERMPPRLPKLQLVGPMGGASSPSLMAVK